MKKNVMMSLGRVANTNLMELSVYLAVSVKG